MPRAIDLRIPKRDKDPLANLLDFGGIDQTAEQAGSLIRNGIQAQLQGVVNVIEDATGLDLQALADVLATLDISSPEAFVMSLVEAITQLPDALITLLNELVEMLINTPAMLLQLLDSLITLLNTTPDILGGLISALVELLVTLPTELGSLLSALINLLVGLPETLLLLLEHLVELLTNSPETLQLLLQSLIDMLVGIPAMLVSLATALVDSGAGLLGVDSPLDATKLYNMINDGLIPLLDASKIGSGQFPQSMVNITAIAATIVTGVLSGGQIPDLDASKITTGVFAQAFIPVLDAATKLAGVLGLAQIPGLPAGQITSGSFAAAQIPALDASKIASGVLNLLQIPTLDVGRIPALPAGQITSGTFGDGQIPALDATKIATGVLNLLRIPGLDVGRIPALPAGQITSGAFAPAQIPGLDGSKITGGTIGQAFLTITNLAASVITSGSFDPAQIPGLDGSKITGGTIGQAFLSITNLAASVITSGSFDPAQIPGLDGSKITGGTIADARVAGLVSIIQQLYNGSTILSSIGKANVPKTLDNSWMPGAFEWPIAQIPTVDSKIGVVDASKVSTGTLGAGRIPDITRAMSADLQETQDHILNGLLGGPGYTGAGTEVPPIQARGALDKIYREILDHTARLQELSSEDNAAGNSGLSIALNFADYPDGNLPSHFAVTYTGSGTSTLGVTSGQGGWRTKVNNANRSARAAYNHATLQSFTNSDYQIIRGTLGGLPEQGGTGGTPKIGVMGRLNSPTAPTTFVWGRGYCVGFLAYRGEMGCTVSNVETVWVSNITLNWSTDIRCVFGVGVQPRRYQFYSGSALIYDHTEVGTASQLGAGFRHFGLTADICTNSNGTPRIPGTLANAAISDNAPPSVVGSGARMIRQNTAGVSLAANQSQTDFPANYFDNIQACSADIVATLANNRFKVTKDGWYMISISVETTSANSARLALGIKKNNAMFQWGTYCQSVNPCYQASWLAYLVKDDYISPVFANTDGFTGWGTKGQSDGQKTSFSIALANRSYA